jgi:hypothetical protein
MSKLKHVVEKKKISKTSWAFYRIKNRAIETKLAEDMAKIRRTRVE